MQRSLHRIVLFEKGEKGRYICNFNKSFNYLSTRFCSIVTITMLKRAQKINYREQIFRNGYDSFHFCRVTIRIKN